LEAPVSNLRVPIKFDIYRGDEYQRSESFSEPIIKIGKVASSHLRLEDDVASRMHAMIEVTGPNEVYIIDLGSAAGTFVNGQKTNKARLSTGDEIVVGETRLFVEIGADAGDEEATMAVDRSQAGLDFAQPEEYAGYQGQPPQQKGTLHGMQAPILHAAAQAHAQQPPARASVPPQSFGPPTGQPPQFAGTQQGPAYAPPAAPRAAAPNPFGNPFAAPGTQPPGGMASPFAAPAPGTQPPGGMASPFAAPAQQAYAQPQYAEPAPEAGGYDGYADQGYGGQDYQQAGGHDQYEDPEQVRYGLIASAPAPTSDEVETSDRAVEVIVMWGDNAVLSVDHLNPIRSYYVGESTDDKGRPTADYLIGSELLGTERMPIVVDAGGGPAVVIPAGSSGDVTVGADRMDLASIVASGRAQPCTELAGAYQFPLPAGATARVMYRGLTFVVRPVNAGKVVGMAGAHSNPRDYIWTFLSFAIHALFLLMMYFMPPGGSALSLDLLSEDSRLAKYLMEPPETVEEETPDWLQNSEADESEGGKGKRHKDEEGQMGKESAQKTKNKYGIQGPADNADPHMAREAAKEEAKNAGILGVLSQQVGSWNSPTSPYGQDTALGYDPMSALGALMGDQIGENFGFGGLGLRGTGRGGGGTGEGTIGLGNVGTIGHGAGGGSGSGYGRGAGGFRGRDAKVPSIRSGNADVRGSLSKEVIRRVIQRHINEVRFCYEQELNSRPDLSGRVQVKFIISPSGAVQAANVESSTLNAARAEGCIAQAVRRWTFPAPDGGGIVIVSYPFVLENAGG
jgi:FHA domain